MSEKTATAGRPKGWVLAAALLCAGAAGATSSLPEPVGQPIESSTRPDGTAIILTTGPQPVQTSVNGHGIRVVLGPLRIEAATPEAASDWKTYP